MAIKFLADHEVEDLKFKKGQVVKNRSSKSEMHFVRRGVAAYYDPKTKALTNHEGEPVESASLSTVVIHNVSNARNGDGLLPDGTAPRAPSGPVTVTATADLGEGEITPAKAKK